ncbi:aminoglycoside phosphotransferase family protein [Streptomyces liangshanensis]|uniref:Hydroxyurea phosphotransferase n=1 Tax=Streptomyces liangshanensis TaxID=2717324 RepID=A0A6G9H1G3_9ACTN|nr:aminoglycoside phosphotransferase family protein [Streptomyces liangshanensis]QIQ04156.1 hydroxyurea phosphotransferase [Streptomyces liangshanensis]
MIDIPEELARSQAKANGEAGRAFVARLPDLAAEFLERWELRLGGPAMYGMCALVLPVTQADGTAAMLKLQLLDDESVGEAVALRLWEDAGAVRLLRHDPVTGALLLEALDATRDLAGVESREAVRVVAELLARLTAVQAPPEVRSLGDVAAGMLETVPVLSARLPDAAERALLRDCAAAVREVAGEPGDRLLHWDLHYENVLATPPGDPRGPWLAIDPKPLSGDPGFDLMPALDNRFDAAETLWRFDLMTEVLGLDRQRAAAWTLGRVLQNSLWDVADGERALHPDQVSVAHTLLRR